MEQLIAIIEKGQPFFNAIARNKYLKAIRDGFISVIPIIIFSSPSSFGSARSPTSGASTGRQESTTPSWKCYNYSMGILGHRLRCYHGQALRRRSEPRPAQEQPDQLHLGHDGRRSSAFLLLSSDTIASRITHLQPGFATGYIGSKGLLTAFIARSPPASSTSSSLSATSPSRCPSKFRPTSRRPLRTSSPSPSAWPSFGSLTSLPRCFGFCFAQGVIQVFQPLFTAADGYLGLAVIYGAMTLFWFVGVHGPSIVEPAISAALVCQPRLDNLAASAGRRARIRCPRPKLPRFFASAMGGTGATLVLWSLCSAFLAKSKEMRAVGRPQRSGLLRCQRAAPVRRAHGA